MRQIVNLKTKSEMKKAVKLLESLQKTKNELIDENFNFEEHENKNRIIIY